MGRRSRLAKAVSLTALGLAALLGTACAASQLTSVWRSRAHPGGVFPSLLVTRLSEHPGARAAWEERLAARLEDHGVRAHTRGDAHPGPEPLGARAARRLAREVGVDGVLATHRVGLRRDLHVIRRGDPFWLPGFHPFADDVEIHESEILVLETNLYDARGNVVWSAVSETWGPLERDVLVEEVTKLLTEALAREGLLPAPGEAGARRESDQSSAGDSEPAPRPSARSSTVKEVPSPSFDAT